MDFLVRELQDKLVRTDRTIPGMLERACLQAGDEMFLARLWDVVEKAETINSTRQAIKDLPLIYGNLVNMLKANSLGLITGSVVVQPHGKAGRTGRNSGEAILSLIDEISSHSTLSRHDRTGVLKSAAERQGEKLRVMVVGPFSTGKTTFLNALLGETLLPAEDRATTACPVTLRHGAQKTAQVEHLYKAEFFPALCQDNKYSLDYREIKALTDILEDASLREQVTGTEICTEGIYRQVTPSRLAGVLDEMCLAYGRATPSTAKEKNRRIPLFSKKIPARSLPGPAVTGVRITLGKKDREFYSLEDSFQRVAFYRAIAFPGSLLADRVMITHPSEKLSLTEFIDTPGLDSLHKRHYDRAAAVLASGNLALFFLHAKHVLSGNIPDQINVVRRMDLNMSIIYVINFADTLSEVEKEKVLIHIRQRLGQEAGLAGLIPYPQVYALSALNALRRGDDGFDRLLRQIAKKAQEKMAVQTAKTASELMQWLSAIAGRSEGRRRLPEKTRQEALYYLGELERFTRRFLGNGVI
jgi:GTPase Era involved in 16S rRNA processing